MTNESLVIRKKDLFEVSQVMGADAVDVHYIRFDASGMTAGQLKQRLIRHLSIQDYPSGLYEMRRGVGKKWEPVVKIWFDKH